MLRLAEDGIPTEASPLSQRAQDWTNREDAKNAKVYLLAF